MGWLRIHHAGTQRFSARPNNGRIEDLFHKYTKKFDTFLLNHGVTETLRKINEDSMTWCLRG
jgi:hypothetical protein